MTAAITLEDRLTNVILADPDVHAIYPTRPAHSEIGSRLLSAKPATSGGPPKAVVSETNNGTAVTVSIGVTGQRSAATVCRDLHDSIATELTAAAAPPPASITIRVSSIG